MFEQREAIVRLLRDDDPVTVGLVKQQLTGKGPQAVAGLNDLLQIDDARVTQHVREMLSSIDAREASAKLTVLCPAFPENGDLESAAWLLGRAMLPGVNIPASKRQLDHWGERVARHAGNAASPQQRVNVLADFLGNALGFCGNPADYYHPHNSLLPRVIETRQGIPISLALLYMLVGSRAGIEISGVNFPGHFLARHGQILFDPYDRGRILTRADCDVILDRQGLKSQPAYYKTATPRAMFTRILANLLYVFQNRKDHEQAELVSGWIRGLTVR